MPRYAIAHLERAGLVKMRTRTERTARCSLSSRNRPRANVGILARLAASHSRYRDTGYGALTIADVSPFSKSLDTKRSTWTVFGMTIALIGAAVAFLGAMVLKDSWLKPTP